jgi:multidrug efflux pump subunit AcrA (membrane-fusion protein)
MDGSRRRRPWWQWVLGAFVGLVILTAIFGADDEQPARGAAADTTAPAAVTTQTTPVGTIADARAAVDEDRYGAASVIARTAGAGAPAEIRRRIANRIVRRSLAALARGDRARARALLAQAQSYATTASVRQARTSLRAAQARAAARARARRAAVAQRRRDRAAQRAARATQREAARHDAARRAAARRDAARRAAARRAAARRAAAQREAAQRDAATACDPNYAGACLKADSPDYDCEGGRGDGPDYTGLVHVVGADRFDLDRDGDGIGCDR